jgi:thiol-disulfide isomerase/thioredoxin
MKYILLLILSGMILTSGCKTTKPVAQSAPPVVVAPAAPQAPANPESIYSDPSTFILGYFTIDRLAQPPYSNWYLKGYEEYTVNSEPLNKLMDIRTDNLKMTIVMGTWCPDSRREVPKLMRILDIWRFPLSQVTIIGVDKAKKASVSDFESLDIQRVPTFIIYKNNIEAGRIIENPVTSLEQDMVNILTRNENINK